MDIDFGSLIPIAGIMASLGFAWIWLRYQQLKLQTRELERESGEQNEEKQRLERRLAVLERIVTDRGLETAEQIEALRGQPSVPTGDKDIIEERGLRALTAESPTSRAL